MAKLTLPWDNEQLKAVNAFLESRVVPIIAEEGDRTELHGTGVLFKVADCHCIITAQHVAGALRDHGEKIGIPLSRVNGTVETLGELVLVEAPEVDLAVISLKDNDLIEQLSQHWIFTIPENVAFARSDISTFIIGGYPNSLLKKEGMDLFPSMMKIAATRYSGKPPPKSDPGTDLLLNFRDKYYDKNNNIIKTPMIHGISGAPVWAVMDQNIADEPKMVWDPSLDVKMVATEIAYLRNKYIKAVTWSILPRLIAQIDTSAAQVLDEVLAESAA